jgi:hypothetical protein
MAKIDPVLAIFISPPAFSFFEQRPGSTHLTETNMAKGQKKSNKEVRKPKADKSKPPVVGGLFSKGSSSADGMPKG